MQYLWYNRIRCKCLSVYENKLSHSISSRNSSKVLVTVQCRYHFMNLGRFFFKLTLSAPRGTDGSFQPAPRVTLVLFVVTVLPCQAGL